ncbi:hypothetical protein KUTeg_007420 [Tegillarca granosa]|uniref:Uncharacterized protein n=1 Tax=Tegillarca granosa TaxID=220873 RepID=A0ABQ9FHW5_TEGGR|nr:hypothetical protein KUTeg_007420 [Tegillarca granosa]
MPVIYWVLNIYPVWEQLLSKNKNGASSIMESVGQISIKSTERKQATSLIIAKKNIVVENKKIENEDIVFPDKSKENYPDWVKDKTKVKISKSALTAGQPVWTSGVYYRNLTDMLHPYLIKDNAVINMKTLYDINSDIMEIAIDNPPNVFNPAIELQFENLGDNYTWNNPLCGWWDFAAKNTPNGAWSTEGCTVYETSEAITICKCTHLTNFAVLMSPGQTPEHHILPLSIISAVGCGLSILFLIITVGVYAAFWRYIKSDRAIILMNLCVALILAYAVFLAGVNRTENKDICTAIAALLHYLFLVAFTMMLAEGIEIAVSVLYVFSTRSRIHWMMPCCWIIPAVIVGISLAVTQLKGYGNTKFCWLSLEDGVLWAFVGPVCLIILINFIIICITLKTMLSSHMMLTKTVREQTKSAVRSLCVILPIMGVSWVLGVFSVNEDLVIFQYIFAICNTLQGLFIFLFHCLTNRQVHDAMKHNRRRKRSLADFTKSTSNVHTNFKGDKEKESSENVQNNMDITKKANPFLEADRQVHEIVGKLAKKEDKKNAFDGKDSEKNVGKDNILSLDDIKISNIVRESEVSANTGGNVNVSMTTTENTKSDSQNSGNEKTQNSRSDIRQKPESTTVELRSSKQSQLSGSDRGHHSGSDGGHHSGSDRGHHSGSDRDTHPKGQGQVNPLRSSVTSSHQYDSVDAFYLGSTGEQPFTSGSAVYEPQRNPEPGQSSEMKKAPLNPPSLQQPSRSYDSVMQQQQVTHSYQKLEPGRYSSGQQSQYTPLILAGDPGPQNQRRVPSHNPSFTSDSGLKKASDIKGKEQQKHKYSPKAQRKNIEQQPSQRQQMPHWGKAKQAAAAKKQMKSQSRDRDNRSRSGDRSRAYAVPVDPYYEQPYARHPSLENVSVQYVGFDPFGAQYQGYPRPRRSRYNQWEEPQVDYW